MAKLHELIIGEQVKDADVLKLKVGKPDVWNPDKTPFLEWDRRWLNIIAYPINHGYDYKVTFPEWRTSGECAPVDGDQEMAPAEEAAGAASVEVAAGAHPANNQDPEADGGLNDGLAPSDPVAPPMSVGRAQPNEPTEAERLAHNRTHIPFADWCESCVRGRGCDPHRARQDQDEGNPIPVVQCDYFFFKAEKQDIMCKAISAIDSVYNRTMALECEFKGLSDQAVPKRLKEFSRLRCRVILLSWNLPSLGVLSKANSSSLLRPTCRAFPPLGRGSAFGVRLNTESFVAFVQVESGRETGRSVLEQGGCALLARPTPDHKSDILLTAGRLTSFFRESALEAHSSAWPGPRGTSCDDVCCLDSRVLDMSNFLSLFPVGELDILPFAVKDASDEFDMFHPLGAIVNFAQEAIIASLGTGGESGGAHASHVSAVAEVCFVWWREGLR